MEVPHPLQHILQSYLISDASAALYAPHVLDQLSSSHLAPSSHLQKWYTRVTSLMHSKDPGARWAGICLAYRTSALSESLLIEYAQTWVGITLNLFSKPEPAPILRISMRYLRIVLSAAVNHPGFQRQIATPSVPKFSAAVMSIAESSADVDTMTPAIQTLTQLIMLYPSQHKVSSSKLSALCHRILGGSAPQPTDDRLLNVTADLFATLHYLGGKVGGAHAWRSCLDIALQSSWIVWVALRSTFPSSVSRWSGQFSNAENTSPLHARPLPEDPQRAIALLLDRLKCSIAALCALLRAPVQRPVKVPIGGLVALCSALLACTGEEQNELRFESQIRSLETAVIPQIWKYGCQLLSCMCQTIQGLLAPTASQLIMILACQLEKNQEVPQRLGILRAAHDLLRNCPVVGAQIPISRLMRAVIASLTSLTLSRSAGETADASQVQSKAGQKRRREFQSDDILSTRKPVACVTKEECDVFVALLDVLDEALKNVELVPSVRSRSNQILLSLLLSLPSTPPRSLSHEHSFHSRLLGRVREICSENVSGTLAMSRSVGLVLRSCTADGCRESPSLHVKLQSYLDLLIHPRQPPPMRTLPSVESLSLVPTEESSDEIPHRRVLALTQGNGQEKPLEPPETAKAAQPDQAPTTVNTPPPLPPSLSPQKAPSSMLSLPSGPSSPPETTMSSTPNPVVQPQPPQEKPSRVVVPDLTTLVAEDDDNEELPTIDVDSDSDSVPEC